MNMVMALIAVISGILGSLVAYKIVPLDKFINPGEAELWYEKYGKLFKIIAPAALVIGILLLLWQ